MRSGRAKLWDLAASSAVVVFAADGAAMDRRRGRGAAPKDGFAGDGGAAAAARAWTDAMRRFWGESGRRYAQGSGDRGRPGEAPGDAGRGPGDGARRRAADASE